MTEITIDVTNWEEAALQAEHVPQTRDELIEIAVDQKFSPRQAAQFGLACRAAGLSPDDILDPDKDVLSAGGTLAVDVMIANIKKTIEINGQKVRARIYKAIQSRRDGDDGDSTEYDADAEALADAPPILPERGYTILGSEESAENALQYLRRNVPGHIYNRLVEIAYAKGDVQAAADELIATVNEFVDRLTNGG